VCQHTFSEQTIPAEAVKDVRTRAPVPAVNARIVLRTEVIGHLSADKCTVPSLREILRLASFESGLAGLRHTYGIGCRKGVDQPFFQLSIETSDICSIGIPHAHGQIAVYAFDLPVNVLDDITELSFDIVS
jgi:hypothetical protein